MATIAVVLAAPARAVDALNFREPVYCHDVCVKAITQMDKKKRPLRGRGGDRTELREAVADLWDVLGGGLGFIHVGVARWQS
jgi:hypothetical protein